MAKKTVKKFNTIIKKIQKRDGTIVSFDLEKIANAIHKAMVPSGEGSLDEAEMVAHKVHADIARIAKSFKNFMPSVRARSRQSGNT